MLAKIIQFDESDKALLNIAQATKFEDGADENQLSTYILTARGSGYSDVEIAKSNKDLQASLSAGGQGAEYNLHWGKGIADVKLDANKKGVYPSAVTALTLKADFQMGWTEVVKATATATLVPKGSKKEISAVTITNPGVYIVNNPALVGVNPIPVKFSIDVTPGSQSVEEEPVFEYVVSNYLSSLDILKRGGGFTSATVVLTLDEPADKAGQANKSAARVTFSTSKFKPLKVTIGTVETTIKMERKKAEALLTGELGGPPQGSVLIQEDY